MHCLILILLLAVTVSAQFIPYPPRFKPRYPGSGEYAASLGGAPVGLYSKTRGGYAKPYYGYPYGSPYGFPRGYGISEVRGVSLGKAPVAIYGKQRVKKVRYPYVIG